MPPKEPAEGQPLRRCATCNGQRVVIYETPLSPGSCWPCAAAGLDRYQRATGALPGPHRWTAA